MEKKYSIEFTINELNTLLMSLPKTTDKELLNKIDKVYQYAFREGFDNLQAFEIVVPQNDNN